MKYECPLASQQMRPVWRSSPTSLDDRRLHKTLHIRRDALMRRQRHQTMAASPSGKQQMLVGSSELAWPVYT